METLGSMVKDKSNLNIYNWLESRRVIILGYGYRFIELKSNFKRRIRDSYDMVEKPRNYQNTTPRAPARRQVGSREATGQKVLLTAQE